MDKPQTDARASRRGLAALVALAFVAGLTLMGYAARRWNWFTPASPAAVTPAIAPVIVAPTQTQPAQSQPTQPQAPVAPAIDPATLVTREAALAGQLAALEARTAAVTTDAAAAGAQSARAEALLVALAARRQIERGLPLGYLEEQLRERFGQRQPRSVAVAIGAARQPVTIDDLSAGLESMTGRLLVAPQDDWMDALRREIRTLVVLRRTGTPSPLPLDRLALARRLLAGGRVEAARTEIAALPGASSAGPWLAAARRWTLAQQALNAIETAALTVPPPVQAATPAGTLLP